MKVLSRSGWLFLAVLLVLTLGGDGAAQSRLFARGQFELPMDVTWNGKKLGQGEYSFSVRNLSTFQWVVEVVGQGAFETFTSSKKFEQGGKGLSTRLLLHVDKPAEEGKTGGSPLVEVAEMQVPGPNYRLSFSCRHKKKKGAEAPEVVEVPYHSN